jgi:hypothetical protein
MNDAELYTHMRSRAHRWGAAADMGHLRAAHEQDHAHGVTEGEPHEHAGAITALDVFGAGDTSPRYTLHFTDAGRAEDERRRLLTDPALAGIDSIDIRTVLTDDAALEAFWSMIESQVADDDDDGDAEAVADINARHAARLAERAAFRSRMEQARLGY